MMSLLEAHCEELEVYSIDEAFGQFVVQPWRPTTLGPPTAGAGWT